MSKLQDMVAFGDAQDARGPDYARKFVGVLRQATRWMLAVSLLGFAFSGVMTYREYSSLEPVCVPLGPSGSALGLPPCVYGLALYAVLVVIGATALARTRGAVGDELVDTSL